MPKLQLADATIAYTDTGRGTPVVLVHGSASSRRQWRVLTPLLARRYRVLAPDLYDYGESSPWLGARPIRAEDEAEILMALARRIARPFHLVGHSYGGTISLVAAPRLGERLLSLTLIEPSAFHLLAEDLCEGDTWDEIALLARDHRALVRAGALREAAELFMAYWIGASRWAAVPAERRLAIAALMPKVAEEWGMMFEMPMRVAHVATLEVPTLLVFGSAATRAIRRVGQLLAAVLPQAESVEIADADHRLPVTHAAELHRALAPHLARRSPPARERVLALAQARGVAA